jgi:hypothetical protein
MRQLPELFAVLSCGLFAGAALYITLVEHPARMECGVDLAAREFAPSYRRATLMQVPLAAICLLSSLWAWLAGAAVLWLVAGLILVAVVPFTLVALLPINKQLLGPSSARTYAETEGLLKRWAALHSVRTFLSLVAFLLFLYLLLSRHPR